jgi:hypothetical protein
MSTPQPFQREVDAGEEFLDEHDPGWWREDIPDAISLDVLSMGSTSRCVLGQRCPLEVYLSNYGAAFASGQQSRYMAYAKLLTGLRTRAEVTSWAEAHGFALASDQYGRIPAWGKDPVSWQGLTRAWHDRITRRRKEAADRGELGAP